VAFESGRRLCVLFEAGATRYAVEATSVVEVAPPDPDGKSIRGTLELKDLSLLLGGSEEERPGMGLVLDVSPTLAARIKRVVEVADVSRSPFFHLPTALGEGMAGVVRGALVHQDKLYLELVAEALGRAPGARMEVPPRPIIVWERTPDRALVFESQDRLFGVPLPLVSQIAPTGDACCPLPGPASAVAALHPHAQALWPIYSAPGLLGGPALTEGLIILTELAGQNVALAARRVLGVHEPFSPSEVKGEFRAPGLPRPALFLDLQRMFS
jgi:chemotaxis signal transduction protein